MGIWQSRTTPPTLLMVGLGNSGKSEILFRLGIGPVERHQRTISFNVETLESAHVAFISFQVANFTDKIAPFCRHYYASTSALIFIIDSNDREQFFDAHEQLSRLLSEDQLRGKPLLVFANKQDLPNAMPAEEIRDALGLSHIHTREWCLLASSALTGQGLSDGVEWVKSTLQKGHSSVTDASSSPLPIMPGVFKVVAESLDIWKGDCLVPPAIMKQKIFHQDFILDPKYAVVRGDVLKVVNVVDRREALMGICCLTEIDAKPFFGQFWFQHEPGKIEPEAAVLVSLQCSPKDDGGYAVWCYSLSGDELGVFDVEDPKQQQVADLAAFLSEQMRTERMLLQFVSADGRNVAGFPGTQLLIDALGIPQ